MRCRSYHRLKRDKKFISLAREITPREELAINDLGIPDVLMAPRPGVPGPAVKPGAVVRALIAQSTAPGDLVVDPFCGSGVAGVEARALSRRGYRLTLTGPWPPYSFIQD